MGFSPFFSCSAMGALILVCLLLQASNSNAQLRPNFYSRSCPAVSEIISNTISEELRTDPRITASLLRLHFLDCFVHGCDASILLDNSTSFRTEKDAVPNVNSARGFDVIDKMKIAVERACPNTVSCADIIAIAARISVVTSGGPAWTVQLGRRDSVKAFFDLAYTSIPSPFFTLAQLKKAFVNVGLNRPSDLVALSGAHTFGKAQCQFVTPRLYNFNGTNRPDPTLEPAYLARLRGLCPQNGNGTVLVDFDITSETFDNQYYTNLRNRRGLIQSDQELFSTPGATRPLVNLYSSSRFAFFGAFHDAMIRMGNLKPLTGTQGEIRQNCRVVNSLVVESDDGVGSSI